MAKLNSTRFREVAKLAAFSESGDRYLFALRSDGTVLRRCTSISGDSYHAWKMIGSFQATAAGLRALIEESEYKVEETRAERVRREARDRDTQRRQEERSERARQLPVPRSAIAPNECWHCRIEAEDTPGFMPRLFRLMAESGEDTEAGAQACREYVDERLAVAHKSHKRSWI